MADLWPIFLWFLLIPVMAIIGYFAGRHYGGVGLLAVAVCFCGPSVFLGLNMENYSNDTRMGVALLLVLVLGPGSFFAACGAAIGWGKRHDQQKKMSAIPDRI